jgi:phosphoglucosamine mutase
MLRGDYSFGGEQSGHLIFRNFSTTGDGLVSALQILRIMKGQERPLSELLRCWKRFPQILNNVKVREKPPLESLDGVGDLVRQAEQVLKPQGGRVLLRYSGTEPKARLLLEGPVQAELERWSAQIGEAIRRQIGA